MGTMGAFPVGAWPPQGAAPPWRGVNFREALRVAVAPKRGPARLPFTSVSGYSGLK